MTVIVQQPKDSNGNPQPMVYDSDTGKVIVDSEGYILNGSNRVLAGIPSLLGFIDTPKTQTSGIQEAVNYVYVKGGGRVFLRNGTYKLSVTTLTQGQNMQAAILIPPTVATNPIIPIIIEGESSLLSIYESGDTSIPPQLPDEAGGVIIDGSGLPNNFNNNDTPSVSYIVID